MRVCVIKEHSEECTMCFSVVSENHDRWLELSDHMKGGVCMKDKKKMEEGGAMQAKTYQTRKLEPSQHQVEINKKKTK